MATNGESGATRIEVPEGWRYVCVLFDPETKRVRFPLSNSPTRIEQYGLLAVAREMIQTRAAARQQKSGTIQIPRPDLSKLDLGDIA